ncbi:MAG: SDR family oxidoreductase [Bacillota bacterium]
MFLVTGGAGFIGSNLVKYLLSCGYKVRVLDNLSSGKLENLDGYLDRVELVQGDINDPGVAGAFNNISCVFHQAAIASVARSIDHPVESEQNNVIGTLNVLNHARSAGVKRVVLAGTAAIYGNTDRLPLKEDFPANPLSPYAVTKLACENYARFYAATHGLETVVLRYFNVFGPFQDPASDYSGVISKFLERMANRLPPLIFGDGLQTRDFIYIDNIVKANLLAAQSPRVGRGEAINIACGQSISIIELVEAINGVLGTGYKPLYSEERKGDIRRSRADISRARELLGFEPETDFNEGLRRLWEWWRREQT